MDEVLKLCGMLGIKDESGNAISAAGGQAAVLSLRLTPFSFVWEIPMVTANDLAE